MGQKKSEFDKVFSAWDILVIAFGAMIGWGWVVSSGTWIDAGGVVGAVVVEISDSFKESIDVSGHTVMTAGVSITESN